MASTYSPGQRIEARCTRCRDITGHIIVAVVGNEVVKVECCACGSVHKYYPVENKAKPAQERPLRVQSGQERGAAVLSRSSNRSRMEKAAENAEQKAQTTRLSRAEQQKAKRREEIEQQWEHAVAKAAGEAKPYAMDASFESGDLIAHSVFGQGVVLGVTPPDRVDVLFEAGIKHLRCQC